MDDDVGFNRPEYEESLPDWRLVDNVVRAKNLDTFLVKQYPDDDSAENIQRNKDYAARASWLGVTGFTLAGLIGTAFAKPPVIEMPASLDYLRDNADGSGVGLVRQMQSATREVLKAGRAGLLVAYPDTDGAPVSVADTESRRFVATIHKISADRIVNWNTVSIGAETILQQVVFTDMIVSRGAFASEELDARRELVLQSSGEGFVLADRMWTKDKNGEWFIYSEAFPTRGDGTAWDRIPFTFIGAMDNNTTIDHPPMLDIARKNRDHYRNSADNEESVYFCGQAQPWANGLTVSIFEEMKAAGIYVGSRKMLGLPEGAAFGYAAAPPNTMVRQAMLDKVEEMASIGARMIKPGTVAKTATQAAGETMVQHSILSLAYSNVAAAYATALGWAADYMNVTGDIAVEPDASFLAAPVTPQDLAAFKDLVLGGILGPVDAHRYLTRHDLIDPEKSFEDYSEEIGGRDSVLE